MTHPDQRTAADDDALLERLHALAHGAGGVVPHPTVMPTGPFPPLAAVELERAERKIGYRLPDLLRRIYTEIGDGGFGPEGGLASLTEGRRAAGDLTDWHCALSIHDQRAGWAPPRSWFYLTGGGCSMEWYVSLLAVDHPVLLYDADGWEPKRGQDSHDGLRYAASSLRQWLWTWADGDNVWDEALRTISQT
ncbi:SMI1/KNR4 family protein [Streptomyces zaomyceticus]|uniref:SMI1/KNR4 family protein n=2 Tax=Streptomyces zaomyceticus TaxID=68286 RepID=UPI0035E0AA9E